jgi:hypothetical protein
VTTVAESVAPELAAAMVNVRLAVAVCAGLPESVTLNVSCVALAAVVGVPVIAPLDESESPLGKAPLVRVHVYGLVPPVATRLTLYEAPTWPFGNEDVAIDRAAGPEATTVRLKTTDLVCAGVLESVTVNVKDGSLAGAVGVPVIAPELAFRVRPLGKEPEASDQMYGVLPPVAVSVALYADPTCPLGNEVVEMARVEDEPTVEAPPPQPDKPAMVTSAKNARKLTTRHGAHTRRQVFFQHTFIGNLLSSRVSDAQEGCGSCFARETLTLEAILYDLTEKLHSFNVMDMSNTL